MTFTLAWALQCEARTLTILEETGLMHINKCGIKSDFLPPPLHLHTPCALIPETPGETFTT